MDPTYRTLDQALANTAWESTSLKRKWEVMSKKKSSSSGSDGSYDGPIVKIAKFRASTASLPDFPTSISPISIIPISPGPKLAQWAACRDDISRLLKDEKFDFRSVSILNVKDTSGKPSRATIIIEVESIEQQSQWKEIIISSCYILHVKDCLELDVEIVAQDPKSEWRVFAIPATHPLVATWPQLRAKIIDLLRNYEWETLDVLLYGEIKSEAKPTIFITTKEKSKNNWLEFQQQLETLSADIHVEIVEGQIEQIATGINDKTPTSSDPNRTYQLKIDGGWSMGVEVRGTGTLGGYIKLCDRQTGAAKTYGLTNYHVVRTLTPTFPAALDEGTTTSPWPSEYSKVQSPSQGDHDQEIDHLEIEIKDCDDEVNLALKLKIKVQMEEATPLEKGEWEALKTKKDLLDARLETIKAIDSPDDLHIGNVFVASGYRKAGDFALDWALVEAATDRVGNNRLPKQDEVPLGIGIQGTHVSVINKDFDARNRGLFFKIGRTTALTVGRYSHLDSAVNMKLPFNSSHTKGNEAPIRFSLEHTFVIDGGIPGQLFSAGGDSGSWVFDRSGSLAGMIWGSSAAKATYVTPIGLIIADIEERTGMSVQLI